MARTCINEGCDNEVAALRPYDHCIGDDCVTKWKAERRSEMTIISIPKAGDRLVFKSDTIATAAQGRHHAPARSSA